MLEKLVEKVTFIDFFIILISSVALISFWRGVWNLLDEYLFPGNPNLSNWVSIVFGVIILLGIAWYREDRMPRRRRRS